MAPGAVALAAVSMLSGLGMAACSTSATRDTGSAHARIAVAVARIGAIEGRLSGVGPPAVHRSVQPQEAVGDCAAGGRVEGWPAVADLPRDELQELSRSQARAERGRSYQDDWNLGLLATLAGRLDEAVARLRVARDAGPRQSGPASDLAALHLARARVLARPSELLDALDAADAALRRAPGATEALFNRALALQCLGLESAARLAWREYLRRDARSGWAERARARLELLDRPREADSWRTARLVLARAVAAGRREEVFRIVAAFPQPARERAEAEALSDWASASTEGRPAEAAAALALARAVGAALAAQRGETMTSDAVAVVEVALGRGGRSGRLAALRRGHRTYGEAIGAYDRGDFSRAAVLFRRAGSRLAAAGSPFADWAAFQAARCSFQRSDYAHVLTTVAPLARRSASRGHLALRGRCLLLAGLVHVVKVDPTGALADLNEALALFKRLGEAANEAAAHTLMATAYASLGDVTAAWEHFHLGLAGALRTGATPAIFGAYGETTVAAALLEHPEAALLFASEYVALARRSADAPARVGSLRLRASCLFRLRRDAEADHDLREARELADRVADPNQRLNLSGDLLFLGGRVARRADPRRALHALDQAVEIYARTEYHYWLAAVLAERARTWLALGNYPQAEADLAAAIAKRERQRSSIPDAGSRIGFFESDRSAFEEMIDLQLGRRHRRDLALDYAERGRARALLDAAARAGAEEAAPATALPLRTPEILSRMPPGVTLVEYAFVGDRLFAWMVRQGAVLELRHLAASRAAIAREIERLRWALQSGADAELAAISGRLHEWIVAPLLPEIPTGCRIVIVPDGPLQGLPFPLLRQAPAGPFLIESHPLSVAPSATLFLHSLARDRTLRRQPAGDSLVVADPAFDRRLFRDLPRLPGARREAAALAPLGPSRWVLVGDRATKRRFLDLCSRSTFVHFGGHALVNETNPMLSELLLAPAGEPSSGVLYARELWGLHLKRPRLVVLAACDSLRGRELRSEGTVSLAGSFLAAGVPAVVASVAAVPDASEPELFARFYARLAAGEDATLALQSAQLECLRDGDPALRRAAAWGPFELIGGSASLRATTVLSRGGH
jgi:CHAT domain-containing protein